jgi:hypothetical protein
MGEDSGMSGIAFDSWPDADRRIWASLVREGQLFEGAGPLCGLRPTTLRELRRSYGYFLDHLARSGVDLRAVSPEDRITPMRLRTFVESSANLAPNSRSIYAARLMRVLSAASPDAGLGPLKAAARNLHRKAGRAGPVRDRSQVPTSDVLLGLGLSMVGEARDGAGRLGRDRAELWRDGLMMPFLPPIRSASGTWPSSSSGARWSNAGRASVSPSPERRPRPGARSASR